MKCSPKNGIGSFFEGLDLAGPLLAGYASQAEVFASVSRGA
jgi:hypothetical protein